MRGVRRRAFDGVLKGRRTSNQVGREASSFEVRSEALKDDQGRQRPCRGSRRSVLQMRGAISGSRRKCLLLGRQGGVTVRWKGKRLPTPASQRQSSRSAEQAGLCDGESGGIKKQTPSVGCWLNDRATE